MRVVCFAIIAIASIFSANGQPSSHQDDSVRRPDLFRFTDGVYHSLSSPLRWDTKDWTTTGIVLASTAAISLIDEPVTNYWVGKQRPSLDVINDVGYWYGTPYSGVILTSGFYLSGLAFKNKWAKETGLILGAAFTTSTLIISVFKPLVGRTRPGNGKDNYDFHPFSKEAKFHSFPSGHAVIAFTLSFALAKRVNSKPLKIFFYSLAASTAFCRIYSNAHWLSDVALGGTIAWFSTSETLRHLSTNQFRRPRKTQISVAPNIGGMTIRVSFN